MIVFKYIEDKDVFQKFYSKMLAKRLVTDSSANDEAEANMISKLKQMCGFEYTTKLQRMFTDSGLSKEMSDKYKQVFYVKIVRLSLILYLGARWSRCRLRYYDFGIKHLALYTDTTIRNTQCHQ
jgi:hypothetical protein